MRDELRPRKKKKGQPLEKKKFQLPLANALCDNTTKFSKFIHNKFPNFKGKILQCATHLTGDNCIIYAIAYFTLTSAWAHRNCLAEEDASQVLCEPRNLPRVVQVGGAGHSLPYRSPQRRLSAQACAVAAHKRGAESCLVVRKVLDRRSWQLVSWPRWRCGYEQQRRS